MAVPRFRSLIVLACLAASFALLVPAAGAKRASASRPAIGLGAAQEVARGHIVKQRMTRSGNRTTVGSPGAGTPSKPDLLFKATHLSDFALAQSAPGAISEAPDPAGSGETVFKMTVSDSDGYPVTPTENPRAELLSPSNIVSGDEIWWSAKFFLPSDFPAATPNFVTLLQGPYGQPWSGTPPFHIEANGGVLKWQRNATYDWDVPWQMPEVRNRWVNVLVHARFAADGFVEMWIDGQQITFFGGGTYNPHGVAPTTRLAMATMDSSNNATPNAIYLQQYRKKGMYPSLTVYQGPLAIGTTRAAVEG